MGSLGWFTQSYTIPGFESVVTAELNKPFVLNTQYGSHVVMVTKRTKPVAKKQVACRRWIGGPQVEGHPWIRNGETCQVFVMADGWAVTSRGYIKSEWLELSAE